MSTVARGHRRSRRARGLFALLAAVAAVVASGLVATQPAMADPPGTFEPQPSGWIWVVPGVTPSPVSGASTNIFSLANSRYVSDEVVDEGGDNGRLRARADTPSAWESFTVTWMGQAWAIKSNVTGLFVSTELSDSGVNSARLRARASEAHTWEGYNLYTNGTGFLIQSVANGLFVRPNLTLAGNSNAQLAATQDGLFGGIDGSEMFLFSSAT